ncbi:unnamed protein product [Urochloa humidicola]
MASSSRPVTILSWNVCGLGDKTKCNNVRLAFPDPPPSVICLQETKLHDINRFKATFFLPHRLAASYAFIPADGASGGILTAWDPNLFTASTLARSTRSLTTTFHAITTDFKFTITNCYGPFVHQEKQAFLDDLVSLQTSVAGAWAITGDFNLVRSPDERSNDSFDASEAAMFNLAIDAIALQELPLLDRRFTWSNHQDVPILAKLDRFFISTEWSSLMPNSMVTSASTATSDHCQLLLKATSTMPRPAVFRFNNFWTRLPGCSAVIQTAWNSVHNRTGTAKLALGLKRCRADLKAWQRQLPRPRDQLHNCQLVIAMMDKLEEQRPLFSAEAGLHSLVKEAALELSTQLALY